MSRERLHEWSTQLSLLAPPPADSMEAWDRIEAVMHPRWPNRTCQGGFSTRADDSLRLFLHCNPTKARRVGAHLDGALGVHGVVRLVVDDDEA